jgi:hypothetical protein
MAASTPQPPQKPFPLVSSDDHVLWSSLDEATMDLSWSLGRDIGVQHSEGVATEAVICIEDGVDSDGTKSGRGSARPVAGARRCLAPEPRWA